MADNSKLPCGHPVACLTGRVKQAITRPYCGCCAEVEEWQENHRLAEARLVELDTESTKLLEICTEKNIRIQSLETLLRDEKVNRCAEVFRLKTRIAELERDVERRKTVYWADTWDTKQEQEVAKRE